MDIEEKRVYDDASGRTQLAVATGAGLAIVGISGDAVGEFGLAVREAVRDVAPIGGGRLAVAADSDVLVVSLRDSDGIAATDSVVETGAGPADAVAIVGGNEGSDGGVVPEGAVVVAGSDGVVRRAPLDVVLDDSDDAPGWMRLGEAAVRAADGQLLAAADGVYRVGEDQIDHVGLDDARDVAADGPFAATAEGCFRLGPGWTEEIEGAVDVVAAWSDDAGGNLRAHAASGSALYEPAPDSGGGRDSAGGDWSEIDWPANAPVVGIAYGDGLYAVAADGTVLADAGDGWRTRSLGLPDVEACAVVH